MKKMKLSIVCSLAAIAGVIGGFATNATGHNAKTGALYYYVNKNNVASPANSDLFNVSSDPSLDCDATSEQICAVSSATAPTSMGTLPAGATRSTIADGNYSE